MNTTDVTFHFDYSVNEIPPRCRKPRYVNHQGTATIPLRVLSEEEAPVAFRLRGDRRSPDVEGDGDFCHEIRWFDGRLWGDRYHPGDRYDREQDIYGAPALERTQHLYEARDDESAIRELQGALDDEFVLFGRLWKPCGEPGYKVGTYGFSTISLHFDLISCEPKPNDRCWAIDQKDDALLYMHSEPWNKHDTETGVEVEVVMPEAIRLRRPLAVKYRDGASFDAVVRFTRHALMDWARAQERVRKEDIPGIIARFARAALPKNVAILFRMIAGSPELLEMDVRRASEICGDYARSMQELAEATFQAYIIEHLKEVASTSITAR